MAKTRDLFNKTGDTKGTLQEKMGTIKERSGKDLTEAEEIKKSGKNIQKNYYKKGHNDPENNGVMVTYLELDILECEVKWVIGRITMNKAIGSDRIPA